MFPWTHITVRAQQTVFQALLKQEDVSVPDSQEQLKMSFFCQTRNLVNDSRKRTIAKTHSLSPSMDIVKANTHSMSAMYFCKTIKWCHQHCTKPIYNIPKLGDPKCSHISWGRTLVLFQNRTGEFQSARRGISAALGLKSLSSWQSESPAWNRSVLVAAKGLRNKLLVAQNYRTAAGALNYPCQTQEKSS